MSDTAGIYSFPKSGNTWVRAVIAALFDGDMEAVPDLHMHGLATAGVHNGLRFYKHHGQRLQVQHQGVPFATSHIIHIRRNPLDVFVSYLNYRSANVEGVGAIPFDSVDAIRGSDLFDLYFHTFVLTGHLATGSFATLTGDYFAHNRAWSARLASHPHAQSLKYEDLLADPLGQLGFLNEWLALAPGQLARMLDRAEQHTAQDGKFYWKRTSGTYFDYLSDAQIDLFLKYRGAETAALGYDPEQMRQRPDEQRGSR